MGITAEKIFNLIDQKDTDGFGSLLADSALFRLGNNEPIKGKSAISEAQAAFFSGVQDISHSLERNWHIDNAIIAEGKVSYVRINGTSITLPFVNIFELEDEKITACLVYIDINPLFDIA